MNVLIDGKTYVAPKPQPAPTWLRVYGHLWDLVDQDLWRIDPDGISEYESVQDAGSIVHTVPGSAEPDISLRVAGLRTGSLRLSFSSSLPWERARVLFSGVETFLIIAPEVEAVEMAFVVVGQIRARQVSTGQWTLDVGFQEIPVPPTEPTPAWAVPLTDPPATDPET